MAWLHPTFGLECTTGASGHFKSLKQKENLSSFPFVLKNVFPTLLPSPTAFPRYLRAREAPEPFLLVAQGPLN